MKKQIGLIAAITPWWFLAVYLVMSHLRPEYNDLTRAISELGTLGAPNKWYWNILGYVLPGLAIALLGLGLKSEFAPKAKWPSYALLLSGLFMTLSGVFPGDMAHRTSLTTTLHLVGSFGGFIAFLVAGFWYPSIFKANPAWRSLAWPTLALVWLSIATGFLRSGQMPGLGQRLTFACYFLWVFLVGYRLYSNSRQPASHHGSRSAD